MSNRLSSIKGKKVVVMGLGVHGGGLGVARWLAQHKAEVLITDLKTKKELAESIEQLSKFKSIKYRLGQHKIEDFIKADIVIANPIVRRNNKFIVLAKKNGAEIYNDASFFLSICPSKVIGITGTKGKSTTANLIYQILKQANLPVYLGGNIRISPFTFIDKLKVNDWVVMELSSWQCEGLKKIKYSPAISVLTNLGIDHLNTYKSIREYHLAKVEMSRYQTKQDYTFINKNDKYIRQYLDFINGKIKYFNNNSKAVSFRKNIFYHNNKKLISLSETSLMGRHNIDNILAAINVARVLDINAGAIKKVLSNYKHLEGRCQLVKKIHNIKFINDTTATAPTAAIATINSLADRMVLIAGGVDKKLVYSELANIIVKKVSHLIFLPGTGTELLKAELNKLSANNNFIEVTSMDMAVKQAYKIAIENDIKTILLSPGMASFGLFVNEFDRGNKFIMAVEKL